MENQECQVYIKFAFYAVLERQGLGAAKLFANRYGVSIEVQKQMVRIRIQELMAGKELFERKPIMGRAAVRLVGELGRAFDFTAEDLLVMAREVYAGTYKDHEFDGSEAESVRMHIHNWFMDGDEDVLPAPEGLEHFPYAGVFWFAKREAGEDRMKYLVLQAICQGQAEPELETFIRHGKIDTALLRLMNRVGVYL